MTKIVTSIMKHPARTILIVGTMIFLRVFAGIITAGRPHGADFVHQMDVLAFYLPICFAILGGLVYATVKIVVKPIFALAKVWKFFWTH